MLGAPVQNTVKFQEFSIGKYDFLKYQFWFHGISTVSDLPTRILRKSAGECLAGAASRVPKSFPSTISSEPRRLLPTRFPGVWLTNVDLKIRSVRKIGHDFFFPTSSYHVFATASHPWVTH